MDKAPDYESGDWGFESLRGWPSVWLSKLLEIKHNLVLVGATNMLPIKAEFQFQLTDLSTLIWVFSTNCITLFDPAQIIIPAFLILPLPNRNALGGFAEIKQTLRMHAETVSCIKSLKNQAC